MSIFKQLFVWWGGQTIGTRLFTWRKGVQVGEDSDGNTYFTNKEGTRRWVMFNGDPEASRVPADWHGWLHHTFKDTPTDAPLPHKSWEKSHQENLTGSEAAYAPAGSLKAAQPISRADYEAWQPE